jgi:plastocyanin
MSRLHRVVIFASMLVGLVPAEGAQDTHTIVQMGRAFHPSETTIVPGETLVFSNHDDFIHQIYVKSNVMSFDSDEQPPGQNVSVTFPVAGTFQVRCHIHPKMSLIVTVH